MNKTEKIVIYALTGVYLLTDLSSTKKDIKNNDKPVNKYTPVNA